MFFPSPAIMTAKATPIDTLAPDEIAGLTNWQDADAITGLTQGQDVTSWPDSSGNGLAAGVNGSAPTYDDGQGTPHGKPGVVWDTAGSNARLEVGPDASLSGVNRTILMVAQTNLTVGGRNWLFNFEATNPATAGLRRKDGRFQILGRQASDPSSTVFGSHTGWFDPPVLVHIFRWNSASLVMEHWVNGILATSVPVDGDGDTGNGPLVIGNHPSVSDSFDGIAYQVAHWPHAITDDEIDKLTEWALQKYPPPYRRQGENTFFDAIPSVRTTVVGSTAYAVYGKDPGEDQVFYATAPVSDPHNWTEQGSLTPVLGHSFRSAHLVEEGGTWYLFIDDRDAGEINLWSGPDLASLSASASNPIVTGSGTGNQEFIRHPWAIPPGESHDGNWHLLADGRDNTVTSANGAVIHFDGTDAETWTQPGTEIISPSGQPGTFDRDDAGGPTAILKGGTYHIAYAGFNDTWRDALPESPTSPHSIGLASSTDLTSATKTQGTPVVARGYGANSFDNAGQALPSFYDPGQGTVFLYFNGHEDPPNADFGCGYATTDLS